jgi:TonB family protein
MGPCPVSVPETTHATTRRFALALVLSTLLHAVLGLSAGGYQRAHSPASASTALRVDIVAPAPQMPIELGPETAPLAPVLRRVEQRAPYTRSTRQRPKREQAADTPAPAPADTNYYPARQLDVYPALAAGLDLRHSGNGPVSGRVLLLVMIDAHGSVNDVSVVEAQPPALFDEPARAAFLSARFRPAFKDGRPVRSRVMIEVTYGEETALR